MHEPGYPKRTEAQGTVHPGRAALGAAHPQPHANPHAPPWPFPRSGRSLGTGYVVFETREEAERAKAEYDGVALDGQSMAIYLAEEAGAGGITQLSSGIRWGDEHGDVGWAVGNVGAGILKELGLVMGCVLL